jgi:BirA family biotin operon repressor/biotin-[acetyl-CoA-carboxylase] ligase
LGDDFASRVAAELAKLGGPARPIAFALETGSTNDDARRAALAGAESGAVFLADAQTRGRGRGDHAWHSPAGLNVYLSTIVRPAIAPEVVPQASLAVGLAVARAVDALAAVESRVKWPNDVLVDAKKIAGVLVEAQIRGARVDGLVVGVGLNVNVVDFPAELAGHAASLATARPGGAPFDRAEVAARLLVEIDVAIDALATRGVAALIDELRARDALAGRSVEIGGVTGVAEGIDDGGRVLVRGAAGGLSALSSGSVALL